MKFEDNSNDNSQEIDLTALKAYFKSQKPGEKMEGKSEDFITPREDDVDELKEGEGVNLKKEFHEINENINIDVVDTKAQLYSAKTWEDLSLGGDLLKGIYQAGFVKPSKIQAAALPLILESPLNLIAQAQNGSGKTATFALAMLAKIDNSCPHPQAMCLCPTRELARQNLQVVNLLGKYTETTTWLVVAQGDRYDREVGAQIIICTPGKMQDFLKKRVFPTDYMRLMVIDEADEMIDHRNLMAPQVGQIRRFFKQPPQILLFSATYHDEVRAFAERVVPNANKIVVKREELALSTIQQYFVMCSDENAKIQFLRDFYGCLTIGQSIIFVSTRKGAFQVAEKMRQDGHAVSLICGTQTSGAEKIDHSTRDQVMQAFRDGETKVLIATDVLSRGIDIPQVTLVINFDLPQLINNANPRDGPNSTLNVDAETYLHRIGRTGRFGLKGLAISLTNSHQLVYIEQLRNYYNCEIEKMDAEIEALEDMLKNLRN